MNNHFMGMDGFHWFFGRVVDRQDPLCLGRVRVRVFGLHPEDENLVPDDMLPWAIPIQPIHSAAAFGIGFSPTGPIPGTHVFGFFADGRDAQVPFILGTVANGIGHFARQAGSTVTDAVKDVAEALKNSTIEALGSLRRLPDTYPAKCSELGPKIMRDLGIKDFQAAGILGNLSLESGGIIPDKKEGGKRGPCWPRGTRGKGYGWAQWTNSRMDNFIDFVKQNFNGYDITVNSATDDQNYKFFIYELTKGEKKHCFTSGKAGSYSWKGLQNTTSYEEATRDFMASFERPNINYAHLETRINDAKTALDAIRGVGVPTSSTGKPK